VAAPVYTGKALLAAAVALAANLVLSLAEVVAAVAGPLRVYLVRQVVVAVLLLRVTHPTADLVAFQGVELVPEAILTTVIKVTSKVLAAMVLAAQFALSGPVTRGYSHQQT